MNADMPWRGDACSLVDEFRAGRRTPLEETAAVLAAIDRDPFNCFSHVDPERALAAAAHADVSLPFGGVPFGVKELDQVEGWPDTSASVPFADRIATETSENGRRIRDLGGAVMVGLTTASEFGGVNVTRTVLNGVTRNPWGPDRTPGGSSGGSAAAVAGGLVTLGQLANIEVVQQVGTIVREATQRRVSILINNGSAYPLLRPGECGQEQ